MPEPELELPIPLRLSTQSPDLTLMVHRHHPISTCPSFAYVEPQVVVQSSAILYRPLPQEAYAILACPASWVALFYSSRGVRGNWYCLGSTMGRPLILLKASVAMGELSVRIVVPMAMKKLR
jgi:hypothetical protein